MLHLVLAAILAAVVQATLPDPTPPDPTPPPAPAKLDAKAMAKDPRMVAALRHANATADRKCGEGIGGTVSLEVKATAQACRRRIVEAARLDTESEIEGR